MLYLVSTPIGNLEDITLRAIRTLKEVDIIAAEDTREAKKILNKFQIKKRVISYYKDNERKKVPYLLDLLRKGEDIALISKRGTPGISDPGYLLVKEARKESLPLTSVPGPSALITALSISGLPSSTFTFLGFLPRKKGKRGKLFKESAERKETLIFYESPYRILATLSEMVPIFGERRIVICRELTKKFEEVISGTPEELLGNLNCRKKILGEFVILISGKEIK